MPRKSKDVALRASKLSRMSNEQLKKSNLIRIPGFTRADGTKVKTHYRELTPVTPKPEGEDTSLFMQALDVINPFSNVPAAVDAVKRGDLGEAALRIGLTAAEFVPLFKGVKLGAKAIQKFSQKLGVSPKDIEKYLELRSGTSKTIKPGGTKLPPKAGKALNYSAGKDITKIGNNYKSGKISKGLAVQTAKNRARKDYWKEAGGVRKYNNLPAAERRRLREIEFRKVNKVWRDNNIKLRLNTSK